MLRLDMQPEVIEFAAVTLDWGNLDGGLWNTYSALIKPSKLPLPEHLAKKTPITDAMLEAQPHFDHFAETIERILSESDVVIAQNLSFDMEMIDLEFDRLGKKMLWPKRRLCTVEQSIFYVGKRLSLDKLHLELTGQEQRDAHRAFPDVMTLLAVVREMRRKGWL